jgi:hypothetical protein
MAKWWKIIFWVVIALIVALTIFIAFNSHTAKASPGTNISATSTEHFAWDDVDGWWNFYDTDTVIVAGSKLTGYASSSVGDMSLDCYTTRNGNICGISNYGVCNGLNATHNIDGTCSNPGADGYLSGYAWNDTIGWISFCGGYNTTQCPGTVPYGVIISNTNGAFSGYAWNDTVGWISFSGSGYGVVTSWRATSSIATLESAIFDTQLQGGGILNYIIWKGELPTTGTGYCVKFQIAVSDSASGPWTYYGPGQNANQYFGGTCQAPGQIIKIPDADRLWLANKRYLRYKIFLTSDLAQTKTPVVEDVILNWSR